MFKTVALAAAVGTAAAAGNSITLVAPFTVDDGQGNPLYSASLTFNYNAGYTTQYNPQYGSATPEPSNSQTYAANIFANIGMNFWHEAFGSYQGTYDFILDIINFTPYGQTVTWSRFDGGNGWDFDTHGYRDLNILNLKTRVVENAKTCGWSAVNNGGSMSPVCAYNPDKQTDYIDPVWKFNGGQKIADTIGNMADIYGYHTYYSTVTTGN